MTCLKCGRSTIKAKCPACGFAMAAAGRVTSLNRLNSGLYADALRVTYTDGVLCQQGTPFSGFVRFVYPDGEVYEGGWKEGRRAGKGKLRTTLGDCFEGEWRPDGSAVLHTCDPF